MSLATRPAPAPSPPAPASKLPAAGRPALLGTAARRSAALLALAALWETAPRLGLADPVFLPPLSEVAAAWWDLAGSGRLLTDVQASAVRSGAGFALAVALAVPLGLLIGWYRPVADLLDPLLELFRNTAALAILPVFVLLLGIGETSKIAIVLYACVWPVLLNTVSAVRSVDPVLLKLARSMDLSRPRLFRHVVLPASVPAVFTGVRLAGGVAVLVLIAAEMVGARAGLGFLILDSQLNFAIPQMYAGIVTVSAAGLLINHLLLTVERRLTSWRA